MPSHCGIASGLNLIPNNKRIFHLANDRFQSGADISFHRAPTLYPSGHTDLNMSPKRTRSCFDLIKARGMV